MADKKKSDNTSLNEKQLVIFDLAGEEFGVDVYQVKEIIRMQEITSMPKAPDYIEGIINLRGQIITVMNLEKKFGLKEAEITGKSRIVVTEVAGNTIGLIVDEVPEVLRIPEDNIDPTPEMIESQIHAEFIKGVGKLKNRLISRRETFSLVRFHNFQVM